ncbi:MAG TPA: hypothetical protein VKC34_17515 [Blastocatellia bacterium]|nr:hypothetical protein [Blastocatellia bacterium]
MKAKTPGSSALIAASGCRLSQISLDNQQETGLFAAPPLNRICPSINSFGECDGSDSAAARTDANSYTQKKPRKVDFFLIMFDLGLELRYSASALSG